MAKQKILIVDDEAGIVEIIQTKLKQEGYEVITAADGQEGLEKARSLKPDLVLLDVSMPKMTGGEVLEELQKGDDTKSIPVIMITGMNEVEDIVKYMVKGGAKDYIVKPFMLEDFSTKIYSVLCSSVDKKIKKTLDGENKI